MALLKKLSASTILENLVASVILLTVFILAGNAVNSAFKISLHKRDLQFDNSVKKMEYLLLNGKVALPQQLEIRNNTALFKQDEEVLVITINKSKPIIKTVCCLQNK